MNRNLILLVTLVALSWVFSIWFFHAPWESSQSAYVPPTPEEVKLPNLSPSDTGFIANMKEEANRKELQKSLQMQTINTMNLAIKSHDPKLCSNIASDADKMDCFNWVTRATAVDTKDIRVCNSLTGVVLNECKDAVNIQIAYTQKNKKLCETLYQTWNRSECVSRIETMLWLSTTWSVKIDCKDYSTKSIQDSCIKGKSRSADSSYFSQALSKNDRSFCRKIQDQDMNTKCNDVLIFMKAKEVKNEDNCASIETLNTQEQCKKAVVLIKDFDVYRNAILKKDNNLCKDISDSSLQETCINSIWSSAK